MKIPPCLAISIEYPIAKDGLHALLECGAYDQIEPDFLVSEAILTFLEVIEMCCQNYLIVEALGR